MMRAVDEVEGGLVVDTAPSPSSGLRPLLIACMVLAVLLGCVGLANLRGTLEPVAFHGIRLGLVARDVRDRFTLSGVWQAAGDELSWTATDAQQTVREAHFEFHMGSLVALRARLAPGDEAAAGEPLRTTRASLLARFSRADGDVDVVLVARDSPTQASEVVRLVGGP
jgi:hypothetical protein